MLSGVYSVKRSRGLPFSVRMTLPWDSTSFLTFGMRLRWSRMEVPMARQKGITGHMRAVGLSLRRLIWPAF